MIILIKMIISQQWKIKKTYNGDNTGIKKMNDSPQL